MQGGTGDETLTWKNKKEKNMYSSLKETSWKSFIQFLCTVGQMGWGNSSGHKISFARTYLEGYVLQFTVAINNKSGNSTKMYTQNTHQQWAGDPSNEGAPYFVQIQRIAALRADQAHRDQTRHNGVRGGDGNAFLQGTEDRSPVYIV